MKHSPWSHIVPRASKQIIVLFLALKAHHELMPLAIKATKEINDYHGLDRYFLAG
ncbi:hypothetical protein DBT_1633 [Dissulfuribacter thermophilus]|uniref:Uncharacterized protein n=1 Tax=Dissulfuribacter thermophilus TaxID=1156395 RepID=A0A1B9F4H6_9BACT|nr:hypothetical protein DBT_1633 [Dissulfuribacter thermophilus]